MRAVAIFTLSALLWPIVYALWISFAPGELLEPPRGEWSLRWYREFFADVRWRDGLKSSLIVGMLASAMATFCGTTAALAVVRHPFRGKYWLSGAILLPLFLPAVILGMGLLPVMRMTGLWGTYSAVAAAHSLWGLPMVFLAVRSALESLDPDLELAARGLGASAWQTRLRITLPLLWPAMSIGAVIAFILSFNELVMALFLCTPAVETLPRIIWPNLRYTLSPLVAAASGVGLIATLALLGAAALLRKRLSS